MTTYLEDLKAELIEGQRLAVDEDGRVLVWTGRADVPSRTTPPAPQTRAIACHLRRPTHPQVLPPPAAPPSPDAERRQLTVMFCDLVDSTQLSSQLDPEEYRDVVRAYQQVCTEVIHAMTDTSLNSWAMDSWCTLAIPRHMKMTPKERYGLVWVSSMPWEHLNQGLQQAKGIQLAVHMGIHTGLGRCRGYGGAGRQEQLALGEVPNIAARMKDWLRPIRC